MDKITVKRYSLSEQVSDQLEQMIENGVYQIGEKIPTEQELMDLFSVSRNTIRESVKYLASAGLLDIRQGDGTYVKSNNRFDANMQRKLDSSSYYEIDEARKILEFSIVSLACERRTEQDLKQIKNALILRQQSNSNVKENSIADVNFHLQIAKACHNDILLDLYKSLYSYLIKHIQEKLKSNDYDVELLDKLHEDLLTGLTKKDQEMVKTATKKILEI